MKDFEYMKDLKHADKMLQTAKRDFHALTNMTEPEKFSEEI